MIVRQKSRAQVVPLFPLVQKADTKMVVNDNLHWEDQFIGMYWSSTAPNNPLIYPPFNPEILMSLVNRNNILAQCIEVMEVNIDGTGHTIEKKKEDTEQEKFDAKQKQLQLDADHQAEMAGHEQEQQHGQMQAAMAGEPPPKPKAKPLPPMTPPDPEDPEKQSLEAFFEQPWPNESMIMVRRRLRYDMECTGNGYMEVLRNVAGDIVFVRPLDSTTMRLVKLDAPVAVTKKIKRGEEELEVTIQARERRFAQKIVEKLIYFKEFGAARNINRNTGAFESPDNPIPPELLGTEIIHFTINRDIKTSYGLPRWINQLPSVIGSRKAEEFNLEFFDSGGVPPAAIFVTGGAMADDVVEQLQVYFSGNAKQKHRVAVVQVQSTSGTIDAAGRVDVKTERFGDTRGDLMFQKYDEASEEHVRVGFRIPPIFLGRTDDYNFATAMTAYMVAEEQVFKPERVEFDERINQTIVRDLGIENYVLKSKPITLKNADLQLQVLPLVQAMVKGDDFVEQANEISGTNFTYDQATADQAKASEEKANMAAASQMNPAMMLDPNAQGAKGIPMNDKSMVPDHKQPPGLQPVGKPAIVGQGSLGKIQATKSEWTPLALVKLAAQWMVASGMEDGDLTREETQHVLKLAEDLEGDHKLIFDHVLAGQLYANSALDPEGLAVIAGLAAARISKTVEHKEHKHEQCFEPVQSTAIDMVGVTQILKEQNEAVKDTMTQAVEAMGNVVKDTTRMVANLQKADQKSPIVLKTSERIITLPDGKEIRIKSIPQEYGLEVKG